MGGGQVVLVDDDELTLRMQADTLETAGFEVTCYSRPLEALAAVQREPPDVIVADYMMPGVNGIAFLALVVETSPESGRILCTAINDFDVAMHAVNTGSVQRIVHKPARPEELITAVGQAVETVRLRRNNESLKQELERRNERLEAMVQERTEALLAGLVAALDTRDTGTQLHSLRVAKYARKLAAEVGLAEPDLTLIERGSLLHDLGKIGVPDSILLKEGKLTPDEWQVMRRHSEIGWRLLQRIEYLRIPAQIVLQHHERWDGQGYPGGLSGAQIVLGARVFQVVDSYDAMTSERPYRAAMPHEDACTELLRSSGSQLDPTLVDVFVAIPLASIQAIRAQVERAA